MNSDNMDEFFDDHSLYKIDSFRFKKDVNIPCFPVRSSEGRLLLLTEHVGESWRWGFEIKLAIKY